MAPARAQPNPKTPEAAQQSAHNPPPPPPPPPRSPTPQRPQPAAASPKEIIWPIFFPRAVVSAPAIVVSSADMLEMHDLAHAAAAASIARPPCPSPSTRPRPAQQRSNDVELVEMHRSSTHGGNEAAQ